MSGSPNLRPALKKHFSDSLEKADPSWIKGLADGDLTVVLTGGGARLPMVRALGQGVVEVHGVDLSCKLAPYAPAWLTEQYPELEDEYPQLAVSIGGAAEELRRKGGRYSKLGILTDRKILGLKTHYKGV